jgi:ABC-type amino acid transport substrate-binding protein
MTVLGNVTEALVRGIRSGDPAWKRFLDTWIAYVIANGTVGRIYNQYLQQLTT